MDSDATLLTRYVEARDTEAFAALSKRYAGMVYGTALRVLGNSHDAEEVAQDCFFTLSRRAGEIRSSLPAWLHRVAVHLSKNIVRKSSRRRRRGGSPSSPP